MTCLCSGPTLSPAVMPSPHVTLPLPSIPPYVPRVPGSLSPSAVNRLPLPRTYRPPWKQNSIPAFPSITDKLLLRSLINLLPLCFQHSFNSFLTTLENRNLASVPAVLLLFCIFNSDQIIPSVKSDNFTLLCVGSDSSTLFKWQLLSWIILSSSHPAHCSFFFFFQDPQFLPHL